MKTIGIVGNGVVGSATGKAFERRGYEVRYWDIRPDRTTHSLRDVLATGAVFVCLPTPARPDGSCDVSVLDEFFTNGLFGRTERSTMFVIRSTVPVGFTKSIHLNYGYEHVYHWPEFLTMRTAESEADHPRCLILGRSNPDESTQFDPIDPAVKLLCESFGWNIRVMSSNESEAVKLFMNAWLAIKNATFNEFYQFATKLGLDWDKVLGGMMADQRIHPVQTQVPGPDGKFGFGGPCLPKDLSAYARRAEQLKLLPFMAAAALRTNDVVRGD